MEVKHTWEQTFSKEFISEQGVRQGYKMSPWLFNVFMDRFINNALGWQCRCFDWGCMIVCLYADNSVLLTETSNDLQ